MGNFNEMSYQQLLDLEKKINIAKQDFYDLTDLEIVQGHLCVTEIQENYKFSGRRTPKKYYDLLSGEFIGTYYIFTSFPSLKEVLNKSNIPCEDYMRLSQIEEVWNQYKNQIRLVRKEKH